MALNEIQKSAIEKLKAQQAKEKQYSPVYNVAEQLMDICRADPKSAELIDKDLDNSEMNIKRAEVKIRRFADDLYAKGKGDGRGVSVSLVQAEKILREFYGLPERAENPQPVADFNPAPGENPLNLDFMDFLKE